MTVELAKLEATAGYLRLKLSELAGVIISIRESAIYQKIVGIGDWDAYFVNERERLEERINQLTVDN